MRTPRFTSVQQTPWSHLLNRPHGRDRRMARHWEESGFTLVELLIVVVVLPLVVGAVALALMSVFNLQGGVSNRLSNSADAQIVSANFVSDVQGASLITTASSPTSPAACGTSSQLLGMVLGTGQTEVSYVDAPLGSSNALSRNVCQGGTLATGVVGGQTGITSLSVSTLSVPVVAGDQLTIFHSNPDGSLSRQAVVASSAEPVGSTSIAVNAFTSTFSSAIGDAVLDSTTPTSKSVLSRNVPSNLQPTISCGASVSNCASAAAAGWTATSGVSGVTLNIGETLGAGTSGADSFHYALTGVPRIWNSNSGGVPSSGGHLPLLLLAGSALGSNPAINCSVFGSLTIAGEAAIDSTSTGTQVEAFLGSIQAGQFYTAASNTQNMFSAPFGVISPQTAVMGPVIPDPYAGLTAPNPASLPTQTGTASNYTGTGNVTFQPGYYPGTLNVNPSGSGGFGLANVTLASGVYYLAQGANINLANVTSAPGGVFIYVAAGTLNMLGTSVTLAPLASPPSPAPNMVVWQAASDSNPITPIFNSGNALYGGTIYAPSAVVGSDLGIFGGSFAASSVVAAGIQCFAASVTIGALPAVSGISPAGGPVAGGTSVTISGSNFLTGASVSFGHVAATNVTVSASGNQITATAPAGSGTVDVTVTTPSGTSSISPADHYTYS